MVVELETWTPTIGAVAVRRGRAPRPTGEVPEPVPETPDRGSLGAYGTYKPDETNTGLLPGWTIEDLTDFNSPDTRGAYILDTPGLTLENKIIWGDLKIRARDITLQNCYTPGGTDLPGGNTGIIDCNSSSCFDFVAEDCLIAARHPSYYRDGIVGHEYTARRCHIYNTNDGLGAFAKPGGGGNCSVTVEGNYIHTRVYWANDPAHDDGTHNDGIQYQGGTGLHVIGNNITGNSIPSTWAPGYSASNPSPPPYNKTDLFPHALGAPIILQDNVGYGTENVIVEKNWIDVDGPGGAASMNIKPGTYTVRNNIFGRDQYPFTPTSKFVMRMARRSGTTITGIATNRFVDGPYLTEANGGIHYNE